MGDVRVAGRLVMEEMLEFLNLQELRHSLYTRLSWSCCSLRRLHLQREYHFFILSTALSAILHKRMRREVSGLLGLQKY